MMLVFLFNWRQKSFVGDRHSHPVHTCGHTTDRIHKSYTQSHSGTDKFTRQPPSDRHGFPQNRRSRKHVVENSNLDFYYFFPQVLLFLSLMWHRLTGDSKLITKVYNPQSMPLNPVPIRTGSHISICSTAAAFCPRPRPQGTIKTVLTHWSSLPHLVPPVEALSVTLLLAWEKGEALPLGSRMPLPLTEPWEISMQPTKKSPA